MYNIAEHLNSVLENTDLIPAIKKQFDELKLTNFEVENTYNKQNIIIKQPFIGEKKDQEYFLSGGVHDIVLVLTKIKGYYNSIKCSLDKLEIAGLKKDRKNLEVEFAGKYIDDCSIHDILHCSFVNAQLDGVTISDVETVWFVDARLNKCNINCHNLYFKNVDLNEINKIEAKVYNVKFDLTKKRQWQDIVDFVKEYIQENELTLLLTKGNALVSKQFVGELVKDYLPLICKVLPNITITYENQSLEIVRQGADFKAYIRNW